MKQDLNLIPKKETSDTFQKVLLPTLLFLLILVSTLYVGIRIPKSIYHQKDLVNESIQAKIEEMNGVEAKYLEVMNSLAFLKSQQTTIAETSANQKTALNVLTMIELACPQDVSLINMVASELSITITGISPDDASVAEFVVNLRSAGVFDTTNISLVAPSTTTNLDGTGEKDVRAFNLILTYSAEFSMQESDGGNAR